jgi:hypothetical protein
MAYFMLHLLNATTQLDMASTTVPPAAQRYSTLFLALVAYF